MLLIHGCRSPIARLGPAVLQISGLLGRGARGVWGVYRRRHDAYCSQVESLPDGTRRLAATLATLAADPDWAPWPVPIVMPSVDSTMTVVRDRARDGAEHGWTVVADEQLAGRGRHGRSWQSPPATGVWASILLRCPDVAPQSLGVLPLLIGAGIAGHLSGLWGGDLWVKWPNDIVCIHNPVALHNPASIKPVGTDGITGAGHAGAHREVTAVSKVAGVLAERLGDGAIVIGVGLNVLSAPPGASALAEVVDEAHREVVTRDRAAVEVLRAVARATKAWLDGDHDLTDYRSRCITLGRQVSVTTVAGSASWTGLAVDVEDSGLLLVDDAAGVRSAVAAGDVTLAT
jgi:BirA family biotin operon repressor/biotin-[acetyl-CoA-carboxylase] ligase